MKTEKELITQWNYINKIDEINAEAVEGDKLTIIDGIFFLVQAKNGFNNVVCVRIESSETPLLKTFIKFRYWCEKEKLKYIRIEGDSHSYNILFRMKKTAPKSANFVIAKEESQEYGRNIYYVKTY